MRAGKKQLTEEAACWAERKVAAEKATRATIMLKGSERSGRRPSIFVGIAMVGPPARAPPHSCVGACALAALHVADVALFDSLAGTEKNKSSQKIWESYAQAWDADKKAFGRSRHRRPPPAARRPPCAMRYPPCASIAR